MKKLLAILMVLLFATGAFAEDAAKFNFSASGIAYATNYSTIFKDQGGDYSAFRVRPLFTLTNGSLEAVVKLEYDATFGATAAAGTGNDDVDGAIGKNGENVGLGADKKALEVAQAYAKTKIDGIEGLTILGGIAGYDFPLIWSDNAPMFNVTYANDAIAVALYYVKASEGNNNKSKDDSQIYIADITAKFGESSIRPVFMAFQCKEEPEFGQYVDSQGYIPGIAANLAFGAFGVDTAFAYITGKDKTAAAEVDYTAYAFDFAPYFKVSEAVKITAFYTLVSGDDDSTDDEENSFNNATIDGGGAYMNTARLFIFEDAGSFTTNSEVCGATAKTSENGYTAYGLAIDASFGAISAKIQGAYVAATKVASGVKKDMGYEFDANIGYAVTKGSTLFIEGAYLKTGKYYEEGGSVDTQDAMYVVGGMTFSL
ncbi:MAG TPA: hypothetical protein PLS36_02440 [Clostridia bacterium]|nr:hypothetical protein [Clostridia bacterium]